MGSYDHWVEEEEGGLSNINVLSIFESIQRATEVSEKSLWEVDKAIPFSLLSRITAFGMLGFSLLFGVLE